MNLKLLAYVRMDNWITRRTLDAWPEQANIALYACICKIDLCKTNALLPLYCSPLLQWVTRWPSWCGWYQKSYKKAEIPETINCISGSSVHGLFEKYLETGCGNGSDKLIRKCTPWSFLPGVWSSAINTDGGKLSKDGGTPPWTEKHMISTQNVRYTSDHA